MADRKGVGILVDLGSRLPLTDFARAISEEIERACVLAEKEGIDPESLVLKQAVLYDGDLRIYFV